MSYSGYFSRLNRHTSTVVIVLCLPALVVGYIADQIAGQGWPSTVGLCVCVLASAYAAFRARRPAISFDATEISVTNTFRSYRINPNSVLGYAWCAPPSFGRDNTPAIELVFRQHRSEKSRIRVGSMRGDAAVRVAEANGIGEWPIRQPGRGDVASNPAASC